MPGFPFGPIRPNTRAGLPLTASVLIPAVRRSLAVRGSGAAVALVIGRKGIVTAMATPDPRICRRVRRVGFPLSLSWAFLSLSGGFPLCAVPIATRQHGEYLPHPAALYLPWAFGDLADECRPRHIKRAVDRGCFGLCNRLLGRPASECVPYVTAAGDKDGATASGGRSCCLSSFSGER